MQQPSLDKEHSTGSETTAPKAAGLIPMAAQPTPKERSHGAPAFVKTEATTPTIYGRVVRSPTFGLDLGLVAHGMWFTNANYHRYGPDF